MKIKPSLFAIALVLTASGCLTSAAGTAPALPMRGPLGCFPVRLTVQTNADELTLRLSGTVPDVNYMVMMRSNKPYSQWLPFTYVFGVTNGEPDSIRISLKTGEAEDVMQQTALHPMSWLI